MVCYHPLKGFPIGFTDSGKIKYKITKYNTDHLEFYNNTWYDVEEKLNRSPYCEKTVKDFVEIPCGQCRGCRLDHSRQWADRCMLEMSTTSDKKYYFDTYFLTLTYDDEHLPTENLVDENGEVLSVHSLVKTDLQDFMKDLREAFVRKEKKKFGKNIERPKIRFYGAGEYGDLSFRPHYHIIIFGLKLDDLVFYKQSELGYIYYNSPWLDSIWKKGFVVVTDANWETCAYTARYVMKKWKGKYEKEMYHDFALEPEFSLMSRNPGIGSEYVKNYGVSDWFDFDKHYKNGKTIGHNRYYEKLLEKIDPEKFLDLKKVNQEVMLATQIQKLNKTSYCYLEMLQVEENALNSRIKTLVRKEI